MNKLKITLSALLCLIATLIGTSSCSTSRTGAPAPQLRAQAWAQVTLPVKVRLVAPSGITLSGRATLVNDSLVHVSMRFLGMELGVINMTQDSIWAVDKVHRYMFAESTQTLLGGRNVTLANLQELMLGVDAQDSPQQEYSTGNHALNVNYADFVKTPAGMTAGSVNLNTEIGSGKVDATIYWDYNGARWAVPGQPSPSISIPRFTPPVGYTRIGVLQILQMLRNF